MFCASANDSSGDLAGAETPVPRTTIRIHPLPNWGGDMNETQKNCRCCREPIDARATKCPHCYGFQTRWHLSLIVLPSLVIPFIILIPILTRPTFSQARAKFNPAEPQLTVLEARHEYETRPDNPSQFTRITRIAPVWIYGTVQNASSQAWSRVEFFVEFKDAAGNRIDLCNATLSQTVEPHSSLEFRLSTQTNKDAETIASVDVKATSAKVPYGR